VNFIYILKHHGPVIQGCYVTFVDFDCPVKILHCKLVIFNIMPKYASVDKRVFNAIILGIPPRGNWQIPGCPLAP
jgi:hypothetical protein